MIVVVNKRGFSGSGIYVGRPSPLGNPWFINSDLTREAVIRLYRRWLYEKMNDLGSPQYSMIMEIAEAEKRGEIIYLICWCSPLACHADVIRECAESIVKTGRWET